MIRLPLELVEHIILQLDSAQDFDSVRLVCKTFASQTPSIQKQYFLLGIRRYMPGSVWRAQLEQLALKNGFIKQDCCPDHNKYALGDDANLYIALNVDNVHLYGRNIKIHWTGIGSKLSKTLAPVWHLVFPEFLSCNKTNAKEISTELRQLL